MKEKPKFVYFNGEITPYENAVIHSMTPCVRYGAMVFEGLKGYWNEETNQLYVFRLEDHSRRLLQSAKLLRIQHDYLVDTISSSNLELLKKLEYKQDLHIRQMLYVDGDGPLDSPGPAGLISVALARGGSSKADTGLHVAISSWTRIDDTSMPPRIKAAANYQNGRLGKMQAKMDGYDNAIFLNKSGKVSEGPGACFFMVRDSKLITPTITSGILESITRDTLLKIASEDLNMEVVERDVDRTEVYIADEAFFCGSGAEITPIVSVDRHQLGNGKVGALTTALRNYYLDVTRGKISKYINWLTPVYSK
jgi:branched-chain amino acid aminotransferase